ncbi:cytochrome P450 [Streptomyces agglomeratus]|uniref:cytochrome P450 n=1 Tax=Streptomyces agglomeratus TaxID=285458 RepID=UPI0023E40BAB|nr:cytochrome P450 [Streptomyces agglomeratus]
MRFDPDRWLDEGQAAALPEGAWVPFGAGKHKCDGDHFALTELTTAVATIARQWRLELSDRQVVRPVARATVRPSTLLMTANPRSGAGRTAA